MAAIRPDGVNLPLLLHVLGAMALVGVLITVVAAYALARRGDAGAMTRLAYSALLIGGVPAYLVMRLAAQWVADEQGVVDSDATWLEIGFLVTDPGLLVLVAAILLAGLAARRVGRGTGAPGGLARAASALVSISLAGYAVAIWAMTTKPD